MRFLLVLVVSILLSEAVPAQAWPGSGRSVFDDAARRSAQRSPSDTLTLDAALARIAHSHPAFGAAAARADAMQSHVSQAHAWPNPWIEAIAENVGGDYSGFDSSELSLLLSQEFELGGKRSARVATASATSAVSALDSDLAILGVYLAAKRRFAGVAHADERHRLALAHESLVTRLADSARERVRAGATLVADRLLAEAVLARVRQEVQAADLERTSARRALAALWGEPAGFSEPVAAPGLPERVPGTDSLAAWVDGSAAVMRARHAAAARRAEVDLERSLRVPTLTAGAGVRRLEVDNATTFLLAASLPLPLWDRRSGAIHSAQAQARAGELDVELARSTVRSELQGRLDRLAVMLERLRQTDVTTLPTLTSAAREMETAYRIGRVSYADLLEVQRMRVDLENEINDLRRAIVDEVAEMEHLTARTFEEMMRHE